MKWRVRWGEPGFVRYALVSYLTKRGIARATAFMRRLECRHGLADGNAQLSLAAR